MVTDLKYISKSYLGVKSQYEYHKTKQMIYNI